MLKYASIFIFLTIALIYFFVQFGAEDFSQIFLTISTFLFAIFTGFFISRQGKRYSKIRDTITNFDGELTSIYRHFGHISLDAQVASRDIIKNHYQPVLANQAWDYNFINPTATITSLHTLANDMTAGKQLPSVQHLALQRILTALEKMQVMRKGMIALHHERIPKFQWVIVYFLAVILVVSVSTIPSVGFVLGAILKAAFVSSVIFVIILLHEFDKLRFFEGTIGEKSAQDVLDIVEGRK